MKDITVSKRILASCILDKDSVSLCILHGVKEAMFDEQRERVVWRALHELFLENTEYDQMIVFKRAIKHFHAITTNDIFDICDAIPGKITNLSEHIELFKTEFKERQWMRTINLAKDGIDGGKSMESVIDFCQSEIAKISTEGHMPKSKKDVLFELSERISDKTPAKSYGWKSLDAIASGFLRRNSLIIVGARASMGKTTFVDNIAINTAIKQGIPTLFFSLEMEAWEITQRLVSSLTRIPLFILDEDRPTSQQWRLIQKAMGVLNDAPIEIDDSSLLTIPILRSKLMLQKSRNDIKLVVIDYLQLMKPHTNAESHNLMIGDISRELKLITKDFGVTIIVLSQLSRKNEARADKRPMLSDLRDSGSLEQDADTVMLLYRDGYYEKLPEGGQDELLEVDVAKGRGHATGKVNLYLDRYTSTVVESVSELNTREVEP